MSYKSWLKRNLNLTVSTIKRTTKNNSLQLTLFVPRGINTMHESMERFSYLSWTAIWKEKELGKIFFSKISLIILDYELTWIQAADQSSTSKRSENKVCPTNCCHFSPLQSRENFCCVILRALLCRIKPLLEPSILKIKMAALTKIADFLQRSIAFTCAAGSIYILAITGRNYLIIRKRRLENAAAIEGEKTMDGTSPSGTE